VVRYFSTWVENDISGATSEDDSTIGTTTAEDEESEDESSDSPRMDFGYQSTGLDFVSSSGYPNIEFGDDDEDDENESESSDDKTAEDNDGNMNGSTAPSQLTDLRLNKSRSDSRRLPSILYIQMEYCEKRTLRDLMRKGLAEDDSWRLVRQVTDGLAHIHSHDIIHRDLKPDNVFIDVAGNPKIGDFGLATRGQYYLMERASTVSGGQSAGDMTRSVGTALYVAPELKSTSGGSYNNKVDMYSLGIMFFEMCEQFETAMERITALQQIREKDHELPQVYRPNGRKAAQGTLITCLISHKPSDRPSSTELLRSNMIPVKIEDETIQQALNGLSDPHSPYHQKMMSAIFAPDAPTNDRVKVEAWDAKGAAAVEDPSKVRMRFVVRRSLMSIFRRHGAEETRREGIFPRSVSWQIGDRLHSMSLSQETDLLLEGFASPAMNPLGIFADC
jgi:eukaryotic translation initiation factor 2-alpha kinase 4